MSGKVYHGEKAIISLTSWKARINTVGVTIFSLLKTCPGYHIVLVLSEEEFPKKEAELPANLMTIFRANLFEIYWVYENSKSFKKVVPTLARQIGVPVISADDDCIYTLNYAKALYTKWINTHADIITYNRVEGWCKTEGPCTLYYPHHCDDFVRLCYRKYTNDAQDDSVLTDVITELRLNTSFCVYDSTDYPFMFHTTAAALNPTQYHESKYKKCLISEA